MLDNLINRIRQTCDELPCFTDKYWRGAPNRYPTLACERLPDIEASLGFRIPELLTRIYTEVGNGGPRLGHGLWGIGCAGDPCLVETRSKADRSDQDSLSKYLTLGLPHGMLPVAGAGNIITCVNCLDEIFPVFVHDRQNAFMGWGFLELPSEQRAELLDKRSANPVDLSEPWWFQLSPDIVGWWSDWTKNPEAHWDPRVDTECRQGTCPDCQTEFEHEGPAGLCPDCGLAFSVENDGSVTRLDWRLSPGPIGDEVNRIKKYVSVTRRGVIYEHELFVKLIECFVVMPEAYWDDCAKPINGGLALRFFSYLKAELLPVDFMPPAGLWRACLHKQMQKYLRPKYVSLFEFWRDRESAG